MQSSAAFKVNNLDAGDMNMAVSRQWLARRADEKFLSLSDLLAKVQSRRESAIERTIDTRKLGFLAPRNPTSIEQTHDLSLSIAGDELAPSHWSFGQLCGLASVPARLMRDLPSQIVSDVLTYRLRYSRENQEIKLYSSDDDLWAATGPKYGRIYDEEVVRAVMQVAGNGTGDSRWKIPGVMDWRTMIYDPHAPVTPSSTTLFASDRDVFMFLVDDLHPVEIGKLPNGEPDLIFRGFYVSNSEVGNGALKVAVFYLRGVCQNRILWGVEGFEELTIIHSKNAPSRFIEQARPALESFANGSTEKLIDGVNKAREAKLASDKDEALSFLQDRGFSREMSIAVYDTAEQEEGHPPVSAWDFAQGITRKAHDIPNNDRRLEIEGQARKILDQVA